MKITPQILSIPPYLSTTWKNIAALNVREEGSLFRLIVILQDRVQIEVPHLDKETVDAIFEAHAKYAENGGAPPPLNALDSPYTFTLPLKTDGPALDVFGAGMKHSPEQANLPPLPPEVLEKIVIIAKAFGLDDTALLPNPEPNCNCMFCQVARSLSQEPSSEEEEAVKDAELHFRSDWDVAQTAEKLYLVTNPLDTNEHYNVFLGDPLGCTCGNKNCEHIRAVLST